MINKKVVFLVVLPLLIFIGCEEEQERIQRETKETLIGEWDSGGDEAHTYVVTFTKEGTYYYIRDGKLKSKGTYEVFFSTGDYSKKANDPSLTPEERKTARLIEDLKRRADFGTIPTIYTKPEYPKSDIGKEYKHSLEVIDKNKILLDNALCKRVSN